MNSHQRRIDKRAEKRAQVKADQDKYNEGFWAGWENAFAFMRTAKFTFRLMWAIAYIFNRKVADFEVRDPKVQVKTNEHD